MPSQSNLDWSCFLQKCGGSLKMSKALPGTKGLFSLEGLCLGPKTGLISGATAWKF